MTVRVAAAGDIHCSEEERARLETAFMDAEREGDLILLAGDLTNLVLAAYSQSVFH